eukprot:scaffold247513_cov27-Tisochrysis_lutea.AAC.1
MALLPKASGHAEQRYRRGAALRRPLGRPRGENAVAVPTRVLSLRRQGSLHCPRPSSSVPRHRWHARSAWRSAEIAHFEPRSAEGRGPLIRPSARGVERDHMRTESGRSRSRDLGSARAICGRPWARMIMTDDVSGALTLTLALALLSTS